MSPISIPGFTPTRTIERIDNDKWRVTVTPPAVVGGAGGHLDLTRDQMARYLQWQAGQLLIQDALPELTDSEREMLMTGLNDAEFDAATKDDSE